MIKIWQALLFQLGCCDALVADWTQSARTWEPALTRHLLQARVMMNFAPTAGSCVLSFLLFFSLPSGCAQTLLDAVDAPWPRALRDFVRSAVATGSVREHGALGAALGAALEHEP